MKNKNLKLALYSYALLMLGCGGNNNNNNNDNNNKEVVDNYNREVSRCSSAVQIALKARPIQHIDINTNRKIYNTLQTGTPVEFNISYNSYDINSNEYYLYSTVTAQGNSVAENFVIVDDDGTMINFSIVTRALGRTTNSAKSGILMNSIGKSNLQFPQPNERNDGKNLKFTLQKNQNNTFDLLNVIKDNVPMQINDNHINTTDDLDKLIQDSLVKILL